MAQPAPVHSAAALARAIPCDLTLASFAKARCLCRGRQLSGLFSDRGCAAGLRWRLLSPYPCKSIHMSTRNSTSIAAHARAMLSWNFCRRADTSCNCASLSSDSRRRACGEASAVPPARRENTNASTVDEAALPEASFISDHARSSEKSSSSTRRARRISAFSRWCPAPSSRQSSSSRNGRSRIPKDLDCLSACIRVSPAVMTFCRRQQACAAGMPAASRAPPLTCARRSAWWARRSASRRVRSMQQ